MSVHENETKFIFTKKVTAVPGAEKTIAGDHSIEIVVDGLAMAILNR